MIQDQGTRNPGEKWGWVIIFKDLPLVVSIHQVGPLSERFYTLPKDQLGTKWSNICAGWCGGNTLYFTFPSYIALALCSDASAEKILSEYNGDVVKNL